MTSPTSSHALLLFETIAPPAFFDDLCQRHKLHFRSGIYSLVVIVWLMIWQRLQARNTLAAAVQSLRQGQAGSLLSGCKRVRDGTISVRTGGFCQARQKLPKLVVMAVSDHILTQLRSHMQEGWPGLERPIFLIDGSSLPLPHTPELVEKFPPGGNQHGDSHWPVMKIVVFHDVFSGLALRPSWGPMYGPQAVSEQALAQEALERLPAEAVVMADSNFGIFAFAHAVQHSGRPMIVRLTQERALSLERRRAGHTGTASAVEWRASEWDRKKHPQLPTGAQLTGRLLAFPHPARPTERLYLFTTLPEPSDQVLAMYKLRWKVETDLRSLKRTVDLHRLSGHSVDLVEKELLLAVTAYNFIRAIMCLAAQRASLAPRQLSFSGVQALVQAIVPNLQQAATEAEVGYWLDRMVHDAAQCKLPQRRRPRSYPRVVWGQGQRFPHRKRAQPESPEPQP